MPQTSPTQRVDETQRGRRILRPRSKGRQKCKPGEKRKRKREERGKEDKRNKKGDSWRKERRGRQRGKDGLGLVIIPSLLFMGETNNYY